MDSQVESSSSSAGGGIRNVYVTLGNDGQEGLKTLDWTLRKWNSNISTLFILHLPLPDSSTNVVYTPYGKLPASSVSDEKLEVLRNYEEKKTGELLSQYIAYCNGKGVKAKVVKVEKTEEPIQKAMVDLIAKLRISTLVVGITFMKSSPSWKKARNTIGVLFYMVQKKPKECKMFIVCGGKLVKMRGGESEEGVTAVEDEEGNVIPNLMNGSTGRSSSSSSSSSWLGRVFSGNRSRSNSNNKQASLAEEGGGCSRDWWEINGPEMEMFYQELMMMMDLNLDQQTEVLQDITTVHNEVDGVLQQLADSQPSNAEKSKMARIKIKEARKLIQVKREEAEANAERSAKADWAISLCNSRVAELELKITEEVLMRSEMAKILEAEKEQSEELKSDIKESKDKITSIMELQSDLSNRLQLSTATASQAEAQLQKLVAARSDVVREMEELRRQRDVLRRRIDFCKERDAIEIFMKLGSDYISSCYREYSAEDIRLATDGLSDGLRFKSGDDRSNVYRGRISHKTVAVKFFGPEHQLSDDAAFLSQMKLVNSVRHPHLVAPMGFCTELKCIIFEYMHEGSLKHNLLNSSETNSDQTLKWHHRIRVAHQVCSALAFLHSATPRPIVYGKLTVSKVLLDRNLVAKLSWLGPTSSLEQPDVRSDIRALGVILLHLLTGRKWGELVDNRMRSDRSALFELLDEMAGPWPLDMADELAGIAMRCLSISRLEATDLTIVGVLKDLEELRIKADDLAAKVGRQVTGSLSGVAENDDESFSDAPSFFVCPILKEVMENPHVAEDGFSYEFEAMKEWLQTGRDTSPMTNLALNHTLLTPNHTLRSLIAEWHCNQTLLTSSSSHRT